jgi:hypothetical protein
MLGQVVHRVMPAVPAAVPDTHREPLEQVQRLRDLVVEQARQDFLVDQAAVVQAVLDRLGPLRQIALAVPDCRHQLREAQSLGHQAAQVIKPPQPLAAVVQETQHHQQETEQPTQAAAVALTDRDHSVTAAVGAVAL